MTADKSGREKQSAQTANVIMKKVTQSASNNDTKQDEGRQDATRLRKTEKDHIGRQQISNIIDECTAQANKIRCANGKDLTKKGLGTTRCDHTVRREI